MLLGDEPVPYDYLILAPGSSHSYFGHDEWAPLAPGLKWIDDALEIRRRILLAYEQAERENDPRVRQALLTFVVVGGGPTGVELAGALAEIARQTLKHDFRTIDPAQSRIVLLEGWPPRAPHLPGGALRQRRGAAASAWASRCAPGPWSPASPPRRYASARTGEAIETRTALWAAGVQASPLLRTLGRPARPQRAGRRSSPT